MVRLSIGATRLRAWRTELGLTQTEASARVGIDVYYYSKIERGVRRPGMAIAERIRDATSVPMDVWNKYAEDVAVTPPEAA